MILRAAITKAALRRTARDVEALGATVYVYSSLLLDGGQMEDPAPLFRGYTCDHRYGLHRRNLRVVSLARPATKHFTAMLYPQEVYYVLQGMLEAGRMVPPAWVGLVEDGIEDSDV